MHGGVVASMRKYDDMPHRRRHFSKKGKKDAVKSSKFTSRNRDLSDRSDRMHVHTSIMGMTGVPGR